MENRKERVWKIHILC